MARARLFRCRVPIVGAVLGAALLISNPTAAAPAASRVLVMPFAVTVDPGAGANAGATTWLGQAVAVLLVEGLAAHGVTVVPRESSARAFDRLQLPWSPVLTRATIVRVGELLGASEIVFGEAHLGDKLTVHARTIRLDAGALAPDVTSDGALTDVFDVAYRISRTLASQLGRPPAAAAPTPPHLPFDAFQNYVKGLIAAVPGAQQRFLESAMKLAPRDPDVLLALWRVYSAQGAHEKALGVASAVPADAPSSRQARFDEALSLIDLGRLPGAYQKLTALHAQLPNAAISNALGVVQLRRGAPGADGGTAVSYFARATREDPGNSDYVFNLGYANALAHDSDSALLWLREAVRYDAPDGDAHLVMSAVLAGAGRSVEAQRELDLARLLGTHAAAAPTIPADRIPAGLERLTTELDPVPALRLSGITGPAQRDQRDEAAFQLTQARTWLDAGNDRSAAEALRRAIYLAPYEDEPHLLLGRVYQRAGRTQDAIDEFKVALWCRETAAAHLALGTAMFDAGDRDGARREAGRALVLDPALAEAQALLRKAGGGAVLPSTH